MKDYKKTVVAGLFSILLGLSCCWLSSLIIWLGGATFVATMSKYLDSVQIVLLGIGVFMLFISFYLYRTKYFKKGD